MCLFCDGDAQDDDDDDDDLFSCHVFIVNRLILLLQIGQYFWA